MLYLAFLSLFIYSSSFHPFSISRAFSFGFWFFRDNNPFRSFFTSLFLRLRLRLLREIECSIHNVNTHSVSQFHTLPSPKAFDCPSSYLPIILNGINLPPRSQPAKATASISVRWSVTSQPYITRPSVYPSKAGVRFF